MTFILTVGCQILRLICLAAVSNLCLNQVISYECVNELTLLVVMINIITAASELVGAFGVVTRIPHR